MNCAADGPISDSSLRRLAGCRSIVAVVLFAVVPATGAEAGTVPRHPARHLDSSNAGAGWRVLEIVTPDSIPILKAHADDEIREHRLDDALRIYKRIVRSAPHDLGAMISLADLYSWRGDYDHSIAVYKDVVSQDTINLAGLKGLARVMRWATRFGEAEVFYNRVLHIEPGDLDALRGLALTFAQQRNLEIALSYIDKANSLSPNNPEILSTRGDILAWGNHFGAAEQEYLAALRINSVLPAVYASLGDLYSWEGHYSAAVDALTKARQMEPGNISILTDLAEASIDAGLNRQAEETVRQIFALDPNNVKAYGILRRLERRNSTDYATFINEYGKPAFLIISNLVIALYFYRRRQRLKNRGHRTLNLVFQLWPAFAVVWAGLYLVARFVGGWNMSAATEVVEFATMLLWMVAFITLVWTTRAQRPTAGKTILAVGAHPDDIELGCGGTLSKYKELGCKVYGLVVTAGEAGKPRSNGKADRKKEAREGALILGLDDLWVCDFRDTMLSTQTTEIKSVIESKIRETGADIIITQSPHDFHQDHQAVFEATKIAARGSKSLLCYEDVSTESHFNANCFIDISEYLEDKIRAVQAHKTQKNKPYMDPKSVEGRAAHRGLQTGVRYAEAFLVYKGVDLWQS